MDHPCHNGKGVDAWQNRMWCNHTSSLVVLTTAIVLLAYGTRSWHTDRQDISTWCLEHLSSALATNKICTSRDTYSLSLDSPQIWNSGTHEGCPHTIMDVLANLVHTTIFTSSINHLYLWSKWNKSLGQTTGRVAHHLPNTVSYG